MEPSRPLHRDTAPHRAPQPPRRRRYSPRAAGDEKQLASRPGTYIDVNWKPAATFALADGGNAAVNREIDQVAASIKAIAPHKVFMTIWWEPQNDVTSDPGGNCYLNPGATGGTPAQYIAMWRNVESRFRAAGVTNWSGPWTTRPPERPV